MKVGLRMVHGHGKFELKAFKFSINFKFTHIM